MVELDENWRVRPDPMCWILEQRYISPETGKESWRISGYYQMLDQAVLGAINHGLKASDSLQKLLDNIRDVKASLKDKYDKIKLPKPVPKEDESLDFLD